MLSLMKERGGHYEQLDYLYQRAQRAKHIVNGYMKEEGVLGVVTHAAVIRNMTAEYFDEEEGRQKGGITLDNAGALWVKVGGVVSHNE